MNPITAQEMRDDYLLRLDSAISNIPHGLAVELRAGIAEELRGDDLEVIAAKIADLGTPEDIAQAAFDAQVEVPAESTNVTFRVPPAQHPTPVTPSLLVETRGYAITAAIVLGAGGFIVPVLGWIIGIILVANSRVWTAREKVWSLVVVPLSAVVFALVAGSLFSAAGSHAEDGTGSSGSFHGPSEADFSPLVLTPFDLVWSSLVTLFIVFPCVAIWLLLRIRGVRNPQQTCTKSLPSDNSREIL